MGGIKMPNYKIEYYSVTGHLLGEQTAVFSGTVDAEQQMANAMQKNTHKIKSKDKDGNASIEIIATNHIAKVKLSEFK